MDIDALFANGTDDPARVKSEETSPVVNDRAKEAEASKVDDSPIAKRIKMDDSSRRIIGTQNPVADFARIVSESSGNEIMEKAVSTVIAASRYFSSMHESLTLFIAAQMEDLGEVIQENLKNSFSSSGFKKALNCLREMRKQALTVSPGCWLPLAIILTHCW